MTKVYEIEWLSDRTGKAATLTEEVELDSEVDPWSWAWSEDYYCLSVLSVKELYE